ncbi:MAG: hypothetical protein ACYS6W_02155 [Planctomycetota bacterium]|jgi:outer membrane lipoprotein-sorting protein
MRPTDKIKRLFIKSNVTVSSEVDDRVVNDAFEALEKSVKAKPANVQPNIGRIIMKSRITKLAAAVAIIAVVSIGISYIAKDHGGSVALGDVVKAMQRVRTLSWTQVEEVTPVGEAKLHNLGYVYRCTFKSPAFLRREMTMKSRNRDPMHAIEISDRDQGNILLLDVNNKSALHTSFKPGSANVPLIDVFLNPKRSFTSNAESLGSREISKRKAVGFRISKEDGGTYLWEGDTTDIWVDAETRRVVLIETATESKYSKRVYRWQDFIFDQELDDSLFSLEIPEGYEDKGAPKFMSVEPSREE